MSRNMQPRLKYLTPNGHVIDAGEWRPDEEWYANWVDNMVHATDDMNFFIVTPTTDLDLEGPNYKALLSKYIKHVKNEEGVDFLDFRESFFNDGVEFTDEEWNALQALRETT